MTVKSCERSIRERVSESRAQKIEKGRQLRDAYVTYWNSPLARESHVNLKNKGVGYPLPYLFLPIILLDRLGIKKVNGWGTPPPYIFPIILCNLFGIKPSACEAGLYSQL